MEFLEMGLLHITPIEYHVWEQKRLVDDDRIQVILNDVSVGFDVAANRFLGYGDSFSTISFSYRLGETTVREIVYDTCQKIWDTLRPLVMPTPSLEQWQKIEEGFRTKWNYPNCVGAIDGKHVVFEKPPNTGSQFYNYKKEFSIVLLALVDADYRFITVDVGGYGRNSDGGIFRSSQLGKKITLNLPEPKPLPQTNIILPHVIVGDEAFPLLRNVMRPYPGAQTGNNQENRIYNYRHCRARRVSENAFVIMTKKFRIFLKKFNISPDHLDLITLACTALHNYLRNDSCAWQPGELEREDEVEGLDDLPNIGGNFQRDAFNIREQFKQFFVSNQGSQTPRIVTFRDFKNFDQEQFTADLFSINWIDVIYIHNLEDKAKFISDDIIALFDHHAPLKTIRVTKPRAPWLTPNLKLLMKLRDKALYRFRKNPSPANRTHYNELRNFVVSATVAEKRGYLLHLSQNRRQIPKNEWYFERTIPRYDDILFREHFRMSREAFEILTQRIAHHRPNMRNIHIPLQKKPNRNVSWHVVTDLEWHEVQPTCVFREILDIILELLPQHIIFRQRSHGFPGVVGAIDGCHIEIKQPVQNAHDYYNRNKVHSIILQDIFVGLPGRMHDARVFRSSDLYERLTHQDNHLLPEFLHILGDSAYPLMPNLMTPFRDNGHLTERQSLYNRKLSSIRSVIERAFGWLRGKLRRLKYLDQQHVLHNFIIEIDNDEEEYENEPNLEVEEDGEIFPRENRERAVVLGNQGDTSSGRFECLVIDSSTRHTCDFFFRKRRIWVDKVNLYREEEAEFHTIFHKLRQHRERFLIYFRMTTECFNEILSLIEEDIKKQFTHFRRPIEPAERLAVTLSKYKVNMNI
nr:unnamed protein product [Callosobruchus chinensis]